LLGIEKHRVGILRWPQMRQKEGLGFNVKN